MQHNDDAYAAMLLTLSLSPNRDEYVRPFSVQEFRRFDAAARASEYHSIGRLLDMDISGLMIYLGLSEPDAYRAYALLHRTVQLTYAIEDFMRESIDIATLYDEEYPRRVRRKLGEAAMPCIYECGNEALLDRPAVAILGISGVKTNADVRSDIEWLVGKATDMGYAILTGGEPGVSRVAANCARGKDGYLISVLGGGMKEYLHEEDTILSVAQERELVLSLEHPEAMFTATHAIARNKLMFSLADAAFVFNTDGRRGETEAVANRYCDWIYAWDGHAENHALIAKGARAFSRLSSMDLSEASRHWSSSAAEQINIFDMLKES